MSYGSSTDIACMTPCAKRADEAYQVKNVLDPCLATSCYTRPHRLQHFRADALSSQGERHCSVCQTTLLLESRPQSLLTKTHSQIIAASQQANSRFTNPRCGSNISLLLVSKVPDESQKLDSVQGHLDTLNLLCH